MERISAYAPDEETYVRAQKLAITDKWLRAACSDNLIWGEIGGSSSEAYNTFVCTDPIKFSCSCPQSVQPCKHSLALMIMAAKAELPTDKVPEKLLNWAMKINTTEQSIALSAVEVAKAISKDKRNTERLDLMRSGMDDLEKWLYDVMAQGLANISFSNQYFWEHSASRFKDSKLSRLAYIVREIADELSCRNINYNKIAQILGEIVFLVKVFKKSEQLSLEQEDELLIQIGRLLRKNDVISAGNIVQDNWIVCGISAHYNLDDLLERKVWLQASKSGKTALILDYLYQGDFEIKFQVGEVFNSELFFYPGIYPQRALFNSDGLKPVSETYKLRTFKNFEDFLQSFAEKISINPWLSMDHAIIENLTVKVNFDKVILFDESLSCIIVDKLSSKKLYKLLALGAADSMTLSIVYSNKTVEVLGYILEDSIYAL